MGALIGFWSPVHGQAKTSASVAAVGEGLASEGVRVCVTHSQYSRAGLDKMMQGYHFKGEDDEYGITKLSTGLRALVDRNTNKPINESDIIRCCYKPHKDRELYHLSGIKKEYPTGSSNIGIFNILTNEVKDTFDYTLIDLAAGYQNSLTKSLMRSCDLIVVCLSQSEDVYGSFFEDGFPEFDYEMGDIDYAHPTRNGDAKDDYEIKTPYIVLFGGYHKDSKTNYMNVERKYEVTCCAVPSLVEYMDALDRDGVAAFFVNNENPRDEAKNFMREVKRAAKLIVKSTGGVNGK